MDSNPDKIIMVSALVVFVVWGFRTLYEGKGTNETSKEGRLKQLTGLSKEPSPPAQFLVGFGFTFFVLTLLGTAAPKFAATFSVLIAVGTTLANGLQISNDITNSVTGTTSLGAAPESTKVKVEPSTSHKENQKARSVS